MQAYYADEADFFGLFEAGTFDTEVQEGNVFRGYVADILVATFTQDNAGGGVGWVDTAIV